MLGMKVKLKLYLYNRHKSNISLIFKIKPVGFDLFTVHDEWKAQIHCA